MTSQYNNLIYITKRTTVKWLYFQLSGVDCAFFIIELLLPLLLLGLLAKMKTFLVCKVSRNLSEQSIYDIITSFATVIQLLNLAI